MAKGNPHSTKRMPCPQCNERQTGVIDSRWEETQGMIRRRRQCDKCRFRFTSIEVAIGTFKRGRTAWDQLVEHRLVERLDQLLTQMRLQIGYKPADEPPGETTYSLRKD